MTADLVSVEKVLNSRCSSEFAVEKSHFGAFIDRRPSEEIMNHVLNCCDVPRFSDGQLLHWFKDGYLFLGFEKSTDHTVQRLLHIESGMQHEAVYLACAAEGVGTCIHNQGIDGTEYGEKMATARHLIMEMADPYEAGKFSTMAPGPQRPFFVGKNIVEPRRDGDVKCITQLSKLATFCKSGSPATESGMSQLLWAARGRTPHCVKMNRWNFMWGLTIPTWGGNQSYTAVYLVMGGKLYRYVNWTKDSSLMKRLFRERLQGSPTHDIQFARNVNVGSQMRGYERAIFICKNENSGRALWEVGYMLENMFLQAKSLGISYESKIFSEDEISQLDKMGVTGAVAALFI